MSGFWWSGWQDSNLRPPAPKAGAIPGYATPRAETPSIPFWERKYRKLFARFKEFRLRNMMQFYQMNRLVFILLFILITGCSGETNYETFIRNNSEKDIKILLYNNGFPRGDTLNLTPNSSKLVSRGNSSSAEEEEPDCADRIDSAFVEIIGGGTLEKDISNGANWEIKTDQTQSIPRKFDHECTFIIRNSDIAE